MSAEDRSFERDIKPLFRDDDVDSMSFAFDLRSYDDVRTNAAEIYERIEDGSMPCDTEWPADDLQRLRAWIDGGMAP
ncbi:MAG: hypothetical protein M3377_04505 [Actinomycetota bacterium]|nr:hypothetical protein [Actinomycetota bacterium]